MKNDIQHNETTIRELKEEIEQSDAGKENFTAQIEEHRQRTREIREQMAEMDRRIQELEGMLRRILAENAATGERRGVVTGILAQLTQQQTQEKVRAASCQSAADTAEHRLAALRNDRGQADEAVQRLETEYADTKVYLQKVQETVTRLANIQNGLQLKLNGRRAQLEEADAAYQQSTRHLESAQQRLHLLKDLERSMNGYQHSVKTVMRAAQNHRLRGIIGPVSTILTVKPGYEVAIETALGFALQNIVVDGENAAKAAMAFLRDERAGRATFLPLDTVKGTHFDASRLSGSAKVASDLVQYDSKYDNIVANLLGRIIVVDEINEASRVARSLDYRNRVVTTDGQVINAGGSFTGGSVSQSAGLFSRKQEIEELEKKLSNLQAKQQKAEEAAAKLKAEVEALAAEITATSSEAITAGGDKIRAETELRRIETALSQANCNRQKRKNSPHKLRKIELLCRRRSKKKFGWRARFKSWKRNWCSWQATMTAF